MRTHALLCLLFCACSPSEPASAAQPPSYIRSMSLSNEAGGSIECDTGRWHGVFKIAADVKVGYLSSSVTTPMGTGTKTTLTINGRELVIEETALRVGETTVGPLSGDVRIEVRSDGVYVDGIKKSDL